MKNKRDLEFVTVSLQVLRQVQKNPFINDYYLTKSNDVIQSSFQVTPKFTFANLCKLTIVSACVLILP